MTNFSRIAALSLSILAALSSRVAAQEWERAPNGVAELVAVETESRKAALVAPFRLFYCRSGGYAEIGLGPLRGLREGDAVRVVLRDGRAGDDLGAGEFFFVATRRLDGGRMLTLDDLAPAEVFAIQLRARRGDFTLDLDGLGGAVFSNRGFAGVDETECPEGWW